MKEKVSYLGKRFTRWKVTGRNFDKVPAGSTHIFYNCICDCGNVSVVNKQSLTTGKSKSCGCLRDEKLSRRSSKDVYPQIKVAEKSSKKVLVEIEVNVDMSFINKLDNLKSLESQERDEMMKCLISNQLSDSVTETPVDNFCDESVRENSFRSNLLMDTSL